MGIVFLAHDTRLDRPVAIKFIRALEINAGQRERFFTEARAVARLSHPNVVAVYRVGEVGQLPYLVTEFVQGMSLAAVVKPISWERALKIGIGLARGLGAAHRRGVLHRDIKPANIMLGDDDGPKLLDFGLAKIMSGTAPLLVAGPMPSLGLPIGTASREREVDATISMTASSRDHGAGDGYAATADAANSLTREGAILGTPLYLAPELWLGARASSATDIYSLGVILYELLAGQVPHTGLTRLELAARVPAEDAASIASRVADLPAGLAALIDACIDRDPSQRPDSADELCDLLEAVVARPPGLDSPYRRPSTSSTPGPERHAMFADTISREAELVSAQGAVAGERKVVAVLFSDLHSFALLSENREVSEVFARLNEYFDRMVEAITSHGGTVDKFIGDAVMAVFGGAFPLASPADAALGAALAMRVALHGLNQQRVAAGLASLDNGTGLSFGEVLYGAVGSADRKEPTVLGDVVVTALQLEAVTSKLQAPIAVSEHLAEALSPEGRAALIPLGEVTLARRKPPMRVFGVRGAGDIS
ncbi:MAG: hypothetical protein E6J91_27775 [Deltaproteobacteria bacterium]|nr:MAG: hypothetical protein E6J91_27775 [Deltaproteobacteria bacterium]